MRLLIITQKIDKNDPILGFFHNWVIKFSEKFEKITVICLQKGESELESKIKVFSLGKESQTSKMGYVLNFYKYIWQERKNYDAVFVHMNQEYVLLGGLIWKMWGKKIYFWRNHPRGSWLTKMAMWWANKVFYTSPSSYTAKSKKSKIMPVGIDTGQFKVGKVQSVRKKNSILSLGRISPVKNIHLMLETASILKENGVDFVLDIVGDPVNSEDIEYKNKLLDKSRGLPINFVSAVPNYETANIYSSHEIFLNLTSSGSFDKTILEAMIYGCVPFFHTDIEGFQLSEIQILDLNPEKIAPILRGWFEISAERKNEIREQLRKYVVEKHSLNALMEELPKEISNV